MASIVLERVSRVYAAGVHAVNEIDLEVKDGEFFVLVGPSGCGKTTTLRLIAGFEPAMSGMIRFDDRVVNGVPPRNRELAMVVQGSALYPHLSVRGNLAFGLRLRVGGWCRRLWLRLSQPNAARELAERRRSIPQRVEAAARLLGIDRLLARSPAELSGGERQRVALGRALVREPVAYLFDEPLSNLDTPLRVELRRELKRLHQQSAATILYVTHDQVEALTLGERIAVMDRGVIQQVGTPREIYERPRNRFVAGFVGSPPMSFAAGRLERNVRDGESDWCFAGDGWQLAIDEPVLPRVREFCGREVVIGIRPDTVRLADSSTGESGATQPAGRVRARVDEIEPQGDSLLAYFQPVADHSGIKANRSENGMTEIGMTETAATQNRVSLAARLAATTELAIGQTVMLDVDVRRLHWFDPQTGENVGLDDGGSLDLSPSAAAGRTDRSVLA